uniref:NAD(P)H-quinone oxidoreductase subunit 5, organellar chromatophore 1 n=1 Tax=Paulinella chromatophora TaxID=39717 RepID=NU5C1_PAUCH|nr:NADH dehydrogenase subunit L [Paulinella chromatophora]B1X491.1 RecName: Full=NAD(P)H-quinone oxidoreductase subunit 5, organellar chromatophore 1; AltName: Full=NAD(P)H dehydrogenase subunit 5 1; AltName: Full=NADH-plastoquinone oxidoreductase subunit 5 1 [Paulinella chromatophora]ACB42760.1 NADH dehydrogenase subunit L [Paulinella chromatophora]
MLRRAVELVWLIPILPFIGAFLVGFGLISFNKKVNQLRKPAALLLISSVGISAVLSFMVLADQIGGAPCSEVLFSWASAGTFNLEMGYRVDPIGATMLALVSTVAILVMVYSDGYMSHDKSYVRFFTYLGLFTSSMLALILSPNLLEIYVFWELVGMCSYLLIGFWYEREDAANAAQKAFVVNRVGDFGFLLGILGLFWATNSFDFQIVATKMAASISDGSIPHWAAIALCLLLFMGPMAKSAQFPLHVWLPDAMEGPTPISALIHAATMVAAGVFLVARLEPLYSQVPDVQIIVAVIGTITCFLGASIALIQMDLKKGLAYSTISQLGYMMLAMGCGAPVAGMFHLITHAFFKAMLFLGSGSVIHAMEEVVGHDPTLAQDMRLMGGLRKTMPITGITFFIGCVAISGIPPLAGFWSKDEILSKAFDSYPLLWGVGLFTAGLTAFYMFRLYFLTFEGEFRGNNIALREKLLIAAGKSFDPIETKEIQSTHESGWQMTLPLVILSVPSVLIGFLGSPWNNRFGMLLYPEEALEAAKTFSWGEFLPLAIASVMISTCGIVIATIAYAYHWIDLGQSVASRLKIINNFLVNKWYLDKINEYIFVNGSRGLAKKILNLDETVLDKAVVETGLTTLDAGKWLSYFETGRPQFYALIIFGGVISLIVIFNRL